MSKLDDFCKSKVDEVFSFPHVAFFGAKTDAGEKYIAVVRRWIDDDVNETTTEMGGDEEGAIRKTLRPYGVRFFNPLMLSGAEYMAGVPKRKNPINETTYYRPQ